MKIRKLQIEQLHTRRPIALRNIGSGVHIVIGPNGSGKSSSALAIKGLLWPELLHDIAFPQLRSIWSMHGKELQINRTGQNADYLLATEKASPPSLPPAHLASCFTITLDEIFDGQDRTLAEEIERDFAGGYDLKALRESQLHSTSRSSLTRARSELQTANKIRRATELEQQTLRKKQEKLVEQKAEIEAIEQSMQRAKHLEKALRRLQRLSEARQLDQQLQGFPQAKYRGYEFEQYRELSEKAEESRATVRTLELQAAETAQRLEDEVVTRHNSEQFEEAQLRSLLETLRSQETEIASAGNSIAQESVRLKDLVAKIPGLHDLAASKNITLAEVEELARAFRAHEELRYQVLARREELRTLQGEQSFDSLQEQLNTQQEQKKLLYAAQSLETSLSRSRFSTILLTSLSFALWGLAFYFAKELQASSELGLAVLALVLFSTLSAGGLLVRRIFLAHSLRAETGAPLSKQLESLEREIAKTLLDQERATRARSLARILQDSETLLAASNSKLQQLGNRYGAHPKSDGATLLYFVENMFEFQRGSRNFQALREKKQVLTTEMQQHLQQFNALLSPFSLPPVSTHLQAATAFNSLQDAAKRHAQAATEYRHLQQQITLATKTLSEVEQKQQELLASLALSSSESSVLHELHAQHDTFVQQHRRAEQCRSEAEELGTELLEAAEELLSLNQEMLEQELLASRDNEERRAELLKETIGVEKDIASAKASQTLARALAAEAQATEKLRGLFEKEKHDSLASLLLDSVESEYRRSSAPKVLEAAQTLFLSFTKGCFELLASDPSPETPTAFRARNNETGEILSLDQLSRGTRAQLLLAARLAFAKRHELKDPIPFIMDEVIIGSDPERFSAIAETILRLSVEDNRQVLYFTSKPEDLFRWQQISTNLGIGEVTHEELEPDFIKNFALPAEALSIREVPEPREDESYQQYVERLGVPAVDMNMHIEAIHLAHLLDSKSELYHFLQHGIQRFGPLSLAKRQGSSIVSAQAYEAIAARADVIRSVAKAARQGRSKPLTPEVIVEQKLSDSFTEPLIELMERVENDGAEFLSALKRKEIPNFRKSAISNFEQLFIQDGYLSTLSPLSEDQARARVLADISPHLEKQTLSPESFRVIFSELWHRFSGERNNPQT